MQPFVPADHLVSARGRRMEGLLPAHADPELSRVRRGFYRLRASNLNPTQAYALRIFATAQARGADIVFSHASAAVLWGAPLLTADMEWVHVTRPGKAQRTKAGVKVHRHPLAAEEVVSLHGVLVTSLARTMVDVATALPVPNVLLPLDHLLMMANQDHVNDPAGSSARAALIEVLPPRSRAASNLARADARSQSAGESLSRGQMCLLGVPMPELQVAFPRLDQPGVDIVDFDWPGLGRFGEFDGKGKYFDADLIGDRDPREVLWEEKLREDRLRRHRPSGTRWDWSTALSRERLAARLAAIGILPGRGARRSSDPLATE